MTEEKKNKYVAAAELKVEKIQIAKEKAIKDYHAGSWNGKYDYRMRGGYETKVLKPETKYPLKTEWVNAKIQEWVGADISLNGWIIPREDKWEKLLVTVNNVLHTQEREANFVRRDLDHTTHRENPYNLVDLQGRCTQKGLAEWKSANESLVIQERKLTELKQEIITWKDAHPEPIPAPEVRVNATDYNKIVQDYNRAFLTYEHYLVDIERILEKVYAIPRLTPEMNKYRLDSVHVAVRFPTIEEAMDYLRGGGYPSLAKVLSTSRRKTAEPLVTVLSSRAKELMHPLDFKENLLTKYGNPKKPSPKDTSMYKIPPLFQLHGKDLNRLEVVKSLRKFIGEECDMINSSRPWHINFHLKQKRIDMLLKDPAKPVATKIIKEAVTEKDVEEWESVYSVLEKNYQEELQRKEDLLSKKAEYENGDSQTLDGLHPCLQQLLDQGVLPTEDVKIEIFEECGVSLTGEPNIYTGKEDMIEILVGLPIA